MNEAVFKIPLLTPRERECLALVAAGLRSKEIGPLLGIDSTAVDSHLKRAGRRTGCSDRKVLARLLQEHQPELVQMLVQRLGQAKNPLVIALSAPADRPAAPVVERRWNDLRAWHRRAQAVAIGLGILLSAAGLIASAQFVMRLATAH